MRTGDLVVVLDDNTPRGQWPIGRVTQIFPGADGLVRVVSVNVDGKNQAAANSSPGAADVY